MTVAIVDYGSGNLRSAAKALEVAAANLPRSPQICVTSDPDFVAKADSIVLPGVGAFADCMAGLTALDGMRHALEVAVHEKARPFLGICVGMQLMAERGLEHGEHEGLGWLRGDVVTLSCPERRNLKIPHMGWNDLYLDDQDRHPLLIDIGASPQVYFVHSFQLRPPDQSQVIARTDYGGSVVAVAGADNIVGTQFHPEKSQATGLKILTNFLSWRP